ncbi:MAG: lipopolysaccharide biosynthesis protein [Bauldia sp.]
MAPDASPDLLTTAESANERIDAIEGMAHEAYRASLEGVTRRPDPLDATLPRDHPTGRRRQRAAGAPGTRRRLAALRALLAAMPLPPVVMRLVAGPAERSAYLGNAGVAFMIRVAGAGLGLFLQVLLARLLSLTDYGVYVTVWTWLVVAGQISALGFNDSCLRFLPRYVSRRRYGVAHGYLRNGFGFVVIGSSAIGAIGLTALGLLSSLPSPLKPAAELWPLLSILFAGIPVLACELYLQGVARSFGWFALSSAPAFVLRPVVLGVALIAASAWGLELNAAAALAIAIAVTGLLTVGEAVILRRRIVAELGRGDLAPASGKRRQLWLRAALPLIAVYGIEEIYLVSDILLLGLLGDPAAVGVYFAAVRVMTLPAYVHYAFMLISGREFSLARAGGDRAELTRRVRDATWWTFWLTIPAVLATLAIGYPLLAFFGPEFVVGSSVLVVLGLGMTARASVGQAADLLVVLGHQRANLKAASMSLALNVVVTLALVPMVGLLGAAIGMALSQAARAAALRYYAKRQANIETFVFSGWPVWRSGLGASPQIGPSPQT